MPQVCRFYQQGSCRFGENCRYEHPGAARNPFQAGQTTNRFGAFGQSQDQSQSQSQNQNQGLSRSGAFGSQGNQGSQDMPYHLSRDAIQKDLTDERPQWILSAYGPGRDAPVQLFGGFPREQSFEEVRWHYEQGKRAGNEQKALNEIAALYQEADTDTRRAAGNISEALKFLVNGQHSHPNRLDTISQSGATGSDGRFADGKNKNWGAADSNPFGAPPPSSNPFGGGSSGGGSGGPAGAFGRPSGPGPGPGQPPFGQGAQPTSTFGQPSALGQGSAFGQPSALGQRPSSFAPASGSAFGQPSALGQQSNPFGQPSAAPNPFGTQPSAAPAPNPFGQPTQQGNTPANPFGQPPPQNNTFGQPQAPAAVPNPFGTTANQPAAPNPFAQPRQTNGFLSAMDTGSNSFSQPQAQQNPFQQAQTAGFSQRQAQDGFTAPAPSSGATSSPYPPGSTKVHPPYDTYAVMGAYGRPQSWKGRPVTYRDGMVMSRLPTGAWERIWCPSGAPAYTAETEPKEQYDEETKRRWEAFSDTGRFEGGMPAEPPLREMCQWDI